MVRQCFLSQAPGQTPPGGQMNPGSAGGMMGQRPPGSMASQMGPPPMSSPAGIPGQGIHNQYFTN